MEGHGEQQRQWLWMEAIAEKENMVEQETLLWMEAIVEKDDVVGQERQCLGWRLL